MLTNARAALVALSIALASSSVKAAAPPPAEDEIAAANLRAQRAAVRAREDRVEEVQDWLDVPWEAREQADAERSVDNELNAMGPPRPRPRGAPRWSWLLPRLVLDTTVVAPAGAPRAGEWRAVVSAEFATGAGAGLPPPPSPLPPRPRAPSPVPPPCLAEVHRRAMALATVEPDRARSYLNRAARAGWLPEVRLRVEHRLGRRQSGELPIDALSATQPLDLATANEARYEARVTWDLGRIVFSPEELAAQATALRMADARRELIAAVDQLFFTRRRLEARPVPSPGDDDAPARDDPVQRLAEIEAELDALSDGASRTCR